MSAINIHSTHDEGHHQDRARPVVAADAQVGMIPALTGGISVVSALQGEQQRPTQQVSGILAKRGRWLRTAV